MAPNEGGEGVFMVGAEAREDVAPTFTGGLFENCLAVVKLNSDNLDSLDKGERGLMGAAVVDAVEANVDLAEEGLALRVEAVVVVSTSAENNLFRTLGFSEVGEEMYDVRPTWVGEELVTSSSV